MTEHPILWKVRTRWAAVGAAVAVVLGAGGIAVSGATNAQLTPSLSLITPCRIMDTRSPGTVGPKSTPLATGETHTIQVTGKNGSCNVPGDVSGVMMNVTLVSPAQPGFITVFPAGSARPNASSLNYVAGQAPTPNQVPVGLSSDGKVSFYASAGPVQLIADVVGYTTAPRLSTSDLAAGRWDKDSAKPLSVAVSTNPEHMAYDGTNLWVTHWISGTNALTKIDPVSGTVLGTVASGGYPSDVLFDGTSIWLPLYLTSNLVKVNPSTGAVVATVDVSAQPASITSDGTSIWVPGNGDGNVKKVNASTAAVTATVTAGTAPTGSCFDGASVWVVNNGSSNLTKINPTTNAATTVDLPDGAGPVDCVYDGQHLWVSGSSNSSIYKLDPSTGALLATVAAGTYPFFGTFDGKYVRFSRLGDATTTVKIDPDTNEATQVGATGVAT